MPCLILIAAFLCFFTYHQICRPKSHPCWRSAILSAAMSFSVTLAAITEILGSLKLLTPMGVFGAWLLVCGVLVALMLRHRRLPPFPVLRRLAGQQLGYLGQRIWKGWRHWRHEPLLTFALLSALVILIPTLSLAISVPPNTADSLTYHMSRVANWAHNQSVAHYPTHNLRQIDNPPWSSFAILHLWLLGGGDQWVNLVQWLSMIGCLVGVSLIAQELGAGRSGQVLAAVLCLTIPMGVLQSVTTQNDYVVSFWMVCVALCALRLWHSASAGVALAFGVSMGLALLTKGTAYIYTVPFWAVTVFHLVHRRAMRWRGLFLIHAPILLLNAAHWWRNVTVLGSPLGLSGDVTKNRLFTLPALLSNLLRSAAIHLATPFGFLNDAITGAVVWVHNHGLGLDVSDPRTTCCDAIFKIPGRQATGSTVQFFSSESVSGNLVHLLLLLSAVVIFLLFQRKRRVAEREPGLSESPAAFFAASRVYLGVLLSIAVLFSFLIVWSPRISRLHLPFFVLASPFVGTVLAHHIALDRSPFVAKSRLVYGFLMFLLVIQALPCVFFSSARPIAEHPLFRTSLSNAPESSIYEVPRSDRYFIRTPNLKKFYPTAIADINAKGCTEVGLVAEHDIPDYLLWVFARAVNPQTGFRAVLVANPSQKLADTEPGFVPCALLAIRRETKWKDLGEAIALSSADGQKPVTYRRSISLENENKSLSVNVYYPD